MAHRPTLDELFAHFLDEDTGPTPAAKIVWDEVLRQAAAESPSEQVIGRESPRQWENRRVEPWLVRAGAAPEQTAIEKFHEDSLPPGDKHGFTPNGKRYVCRLAAQEQLKEAPYGVVVLRVMRDSQLLHSYILLLKPDTRSLHDSKFWMAAVPTHELAAAWKLSDVDMLDVQRQQKRLLLTVTGLTDKELVGLQPSELADLRDLMARLSKSGDPRCPMVQALLNVVDSTRQPAQEHSET